MKKKGKRATLGSIQQKIFRTQLILIVTLSLFLGLAGTLINLHLETEKRDQNLRNIAQTVAHFLSAEAKSDDLRISEKQQKYLIFLQDTIEDIDIISVVNKENQRMFHTNEELINTTYDGTLPIFSEDAEGYYISNDVGPSGTQRRAYFAIYNEEGQYMGFVLTVTLMKNIRQDTFHILFVFALITLAAIFMESIISAYISDNIKKELKGYEPDVFSAMFRIRENIIESLEEGIVATDNENNVQFMNKAAISMLGKVEEKLDMSSPDLGNNHILLDKIPIKEGGMTVGAVGIFRNREEYTKLMEDLAGTRYLVDSMRASNHDFTNKLHVILGLIQMEMYEEAVSYIQNITIVQRDTISKIMRAIDEPALAALLIGKIARAAELNVKFILRENSNYSKTVIQYPTEFLVTVVGNLIDNAFDAMNDGNYNAEKELLFGIYAREDALLITVDDTGTGICSENQNRIFENGFSTKGEGRGTGLFQVKNMVERLGGKITMESQIGVGTSFSVSLWKEKKEDGNV